MTGGLALARLAFALLPLAALAGACGGSEIEVETRTSALAASIAKMKELQVLIDGIVDERTARAAAGEVEKRVAELDSLWREVEAQGALPREVEEAVKAMQRRLAPYPALLRAVGKLERPSRTGK